MGVMDKIINQDLCIELISDKISKALRDKRYEDSEQSAALLREIQNDLAEFLADGSCCESLFASFSQIDSESTWTLHYIYQTILNPKPTDDMHYGTAILKLDLDGNLNGIYYTNRCVQTKGKMSLKRKYI